MDFENYAEELEKIVTQMASIGADRYLGKNISSRLPTIIKGLNYINEFMDERVSHGSEMYEYLVDVAYQLYRMKDEAERT